MFEAVEESYVLVIDDDELIWFLIRDVLRQMDLLKGLKTFSEAEMALEFLRGLPTAPSSLVVDLNLPGMNGFGFLEHFQQELQERFSQTAVFVVSASTRFEDRERALSFPFVRNYYSKPLRLAQLREILRPEPTPLTVPDPGLAVLPDQPFSAALPA